jgi:hypothetical protein
MLFATLHIAVGMFICSELVKFIREEEDLVWALSKLGAPPPRLKAPSLVPLTLIMMALQFGMAWVWIVRS